MSESTSHVEHVNPNPTPEQTPESVVQEQEATAVQEQTEHVIVQAAEQLEAELELARDEAEQTVKALVKAFTRGIRAHLASMLDTGELADKFLHQRMGIGQRAGSGKGARTERANGVKRLELEMLRAGGDAVDVNRVIAVYHVHRLLCLDQGMGKKSGQSYAAYRDNWTRLVERVNKDTPEEAWVLLPGLEQECKTLYTRAVEEELSQDTVAGECKLLLRTYADRQAEEAAKVKVAAEEQASRLAAERKAAEDAAMDAVQETKRVREEAEQAREEDRARMAEVVKAAEEAERQRVEEARRKQGEAEAAERERGRADRSAAEAEKAKRKAEDKARKAEERRGQTAGPTCRAKNLLPTDEPTDPAAVAGMAAEFIADSGAPDDVLQLLLMRLKDCPELSSRAKRAILAALTVLTREEKPAVKPVGNGKLIQAAA